MFKEKSHIKASPSASNISSLQYSQEGSFMKRSKDLMTSCCVVLRVLTLHFTEVSQCCRPARDRAKHGSRSDWVSFQHSRLTVSAEVAVIKQLSHFSCVLWGTAEARTTFTSEGACSPVLWPRFEGAAHPVSETLVVLNMFYLTMWSYLVLIHFKISLKQTDICVFSFSYSHIYDWFFPVSGSCLLNVWSWQYHHERKLTESYINFVFWDLRNLFIVLKTSLLFPHCKNWNKCLENRFQGPF